jgi:glucokinase
MKARRPRPARLRAIPRIDLVQHTAERPVLAIDLGGTQIRAALVTPDRAVHHRRAVPTRDEEGVTATLDRIAEVARGVLDDAGRDGLPDPVGVGISSPGPLDPWRGIVLAPPNLRDWRDVPVAEAVEEALGLPAFLERDTNVAVMAEWRYGAAAGSRDAIYVTVSTGVGGGIIVDGQPLVGQAGLAGEVGHLVVEIDGPTCGCGGIGHVEAIASGTALERVARELVGAPGATTLSRMAAEGEPVDARLLARAAESGDAAAAAAFERAWVAIGALCASLGNVLAPQVIVIGGAIAAHHPRLFEVARREVERRSLPGFADRVRILPAALGGNVSLIGLLPIVNDRLGDPAYRRASRPSPPATVPEGAPVS